MKRFWDKVDKSGDCWLWTAFKHPKGYGYFRVGSKTVRAHRFAWELANGPIQTDLCVLHRCDVRACVNPNHLFLGSIADNNHDMAAKGRAVGLRGSKNGFAKLTDEAVRVIRIYCEHGHSQRSIAKALKISRQAVGTVVRRERWKHIDLITRAA